MILRALYQLATEAEQLVPDPDFQIVPVAWLVRVATDGRILGIDDFREAVEPAGRARRVRYRAQPMRVPRQKSNRSGTKAPPNFLVDNAKYVFGLATPDKPFSPAEGREKSGWFLRDVVRCGAATGDAAVRAVQTALEDVASGHQSVALPADCRSNDQFAFVYAPDADVPVHERPAVVEYWRSLRAASSEDTGTSNARFECVVTGRPVRDPDNFPKVRKVPGAVTAGTPLVSFNAPAFESYGWEANENAAIARDVAEACATALQRLVDPAFPDPRPEHRGETLPRRNVRLGDATLVVYWASSAQAREAVDAFGLALDSSGDPAVVGEAYRSWESGWPAVISEPARFHALTLSGAQGRLVIRDWFETSLATALANLAQYFTDLRVVRNTPPPRDRALPPIPPLDTLTTSLAAFGKREDVPEPLVSSFVSAAIRGTLLPLSVLQRALERTRAEIGKDAWADLNRRDARAALIKAVLARRRRLAPHLATYPEPTEAMDPSNQNPGYLLGRLMAVLEKMQQVALGDPNASVVDRYFSAASARPRGVFVRLLKNAQHHARKAEDDERTAGLAHWLKRQVDEIADRFDPRNNGFPAALSLEEQGLFVLGYHQQRHWLSLPKEQRERSGPTHAEAAAPAA